MAEPSCSANRLDLVVTEVRAETPQIRALRLARPRGEPLPSWEAGAHVKVRLRDGDERSYSLIDASGDAAATIEPRAYRLGIRLEETSKGGSRFMHNLRVGDPVAVSPPANNFPLAASANSPVLLAGGIGVTPIISMATALVAGGRAFRFIYAGRSREQLAFLPEIEALVGSQLTIHADDKAGIFDVRTLMASLTGNEPLYLCGPTPMLDAALACANDLGWDKGRLRFEIFSSAAPVAGDQPFEVVLKRSGKSYTIPADKSILDVLIAAGEGPLHDCKRGDCGVCQVGVVEGTPDHRDYILSDAEKAAGTLMQICVSRSKSPRLVIDL
jgi:vanillate O-demethylase ferredoxin subunit